MPEIEKYIEKKLKGRTYERPDLSVLSEDPVVIEANIGNEESI